MNLDNLEEKIQQLHDHLFQIKKTKERMAVIALQLEMLYNDLSIHKKKMKKEHEDVLKLEKSSALQLFRNILGDSRQQLEKERQEYMQAVLEYNSIANEINLLKYEEEILSKKSIETEDLQRQLDYYLKVKEQKLLYHNVDEAKQIKEINREIDRLSSFRREIKEARSAALAVEKAIQKAHIKLKKVELFQTSKMGGVGHNSSYAKKTYIDGAIKDASVINFLLGKLDKELSHIYSQYTFFSIYKYQNFVDSFYDHLITDWVLQNKLKNAINCLQSAEDQTRRILANLDTDMEKTNASIQANTLKKREIVRNL